MEREREVVTSDLTVEYLGKRTAAGWRVAAIEWVRGEPAGQSEISSSAELKPQADVPYGLECSPEQSCLRENPLEMTVLFLILENIIQEKRISEIAAALNQEGFKTRDGRHWSPTAVFELMPRLVDVGPSLLKSKSWRERRAKAPSPLQ